MPSLFKLETLKFIGGASIVLTAICIMLPGVMGYAFSLARLGLVILIAIVLSSVLGFTVQFILNKGKTGASSTASGATDNTSANAGADTSSSANSSFGANSSSNSNPSSNTSGSGNT